MVVPLRVILICLPDALIFTESVVFNACIITTVSYITVQDLVGRRKPYFCGESVGYENAERESHVYSAWINPPLVPMKVKAN